MLLRANGTYSSIIIKIFTNMINREATGLSIDYDKTGKVIVRRVLMAT